MLPTPTMPMRTRSTSVLELFHELEPHATGRFHERNAAPNERAGDDLRAPQHVVRFELPVEIVGEHRGVEEPLGGRADVVLVDRTREQRDLHRAEPHLGALTATPL